jgi:hypothetical protein
MKCCAGARFSRASSTRRMIRARSVSSAPWVTSTVRAPPERIVAAKTWSPASFRTGSDSPVIAAWSTSPAPSSTFPSDAIRSPGCTRIRSPGLEGQHRDPPHLLAVIAHLRGLLGPKFHQRLHGAPRLPQRPVLEGVRQREQEDQHHPFEGLPHRRRPERRRPHQEVDGELPAAERLPGSPGDGDPPHQVRHAEGEPPPGRRIVGDPLQERAGNGSGQDPEGVRKGTAGAEVASLIPGRLPWPGEGGKPRTGPASWIEPAQRPHAAPLAAEPCEHADHLGGGWGWVKRRWRERLISGSCRLPPGVIHCTT